MPEIRTELEIAASPERCWKVLADFPRYPEWNPFLIGLTGVPSVGTPVDVTVKSGLVTVVFHTTVVTASPAQELRWRGHFLTDNLVAAEHYFKLEPLGGDRSRFIHGEVFTGAISRVAWAIIARDTRRGYAKMNAAFKTRAEAGA